MIQMKKKKYTLDMQTLNKLVEPLEKLQKLNGWS